MGTKQKQRSINYGHWRKYSSLEIWQVACLMLRTDPRDYMAGEVVVNEAGDGLDITEEVTMLTSAVQTGDIAAIPLTPATVDAKTQILRNSTVPWLRAHGYRETADGWEITPVELENAGASATGLPTTVASPPTPPDTSLGSLHVGTPVKRKVLVANNIQRWPSIERDLLDASKNGLAKAAKAGGRDWYVDEALKWAASRGKTKASKVVDPLDDAVRAMSVLKHTLDK